MFDVRIAKINAARKAVEELLNMLESVNIIGIGTGSTVEEFIKQLSKFRETLADKYFTASSIDTVLKMKKYGFKIVHPASLSTIDVYIDGADEVDPSLNMVKGGGAALFLEKILTYYSRYRLFIVDYSKLVGWLGEKHPIPLEVNFYAVSFVEELLKNKGYNIAVRRPVKGKYGPVISDTFGVIIDLYLNDPVDIVRLESELKHVPGIIETGLFIGLADKVIVGYEDSARVLERNKTLTLPREN